MIWALCESCACMFCVCSVYVWRVYSCDAILISRVTHNDRCCDDVNFYSYNECSVRCMRNERDDDTFAWQFLYYSLSFLFSFCFCSAFATSLWDLQRHFNENKTAHNGLGKIVHCFQEMNKYQTILLDQASRTILKNITTFLKTDIKEVKEYKNIFVKASESYDTALTRNAQANKNRPQEVMEAANILSAASSGFRHTALDYVNLLTLLQSKKMPEILSTVSMSTQRGEIDTKWACAATDIVNRMM